MPTLAELRAQTGPRPRPTGSRIVTLVEGQHLLAESQRLEEERIDLLVQAEVDADAAKEDGRARTVKSGEKPAPVEPPRVAEIRERQREIVSLLRAHQSEVGLTGMEGGEWQRWKDEHPPRDENLADFRLTRGHCNSSELFKALGRFVTSWDGEPLAEGDWDNWLSERIVYADRRDLVTDVVAMHEDSVTRVPKSLSESSPTESSATD